MNKRNSNNFISKYEGRKRNDEIHYEEERRRLEKERKRLEEERRRLHEECRMLEEEDERRMHEKRSRHEDHYDERQRLDYEQLDERQRHDHFDEERRRFHEERRRLEEERRRLHEECRMLEEEEERRMHEKRSRHEDHYDEMERIDYDQLDERQRHDHFDEERRRFHEERRRHDGLLDEDRRKHDYHYDQGQRIHGDLYDELSRKYDEDRRRLNDERRRNDEYRRIDDGHFEKERRRSDDCYGEERIRNVEQNFGNDGFFHEGRKRPSEERRRHEEKFRRIEQQEDSCTNPFRSNKAFRLPSVDEPGDPHVKILKRLAFDWERKWYLQYIKSGSSPDEAYKETLIRREARQNRLNKKKEQRQTRALNRILAKSVQQLEEDRAESITAEISESDKKKDQCDRYIKLLNLEGVQKAYFRKLFLEQGYPFEICEEIILSSQKKSSESIETFLNRKEEVQRIRQKHRLKGAPKKWLYRLIFEDGYLPDEAEEILLKRIEETTAMLTNNRHSETNNTANQQSDTNCSAKGNPFKTDSEKCLEMVIVPKDYPGKKLGEESLHLLEIALRDKAASGRRFIVLIEGITFGEGMLQVNCGNPQTAQWLIQVAPKLNNWNNIELVACLKDDLPVEQSISLLLPNSAGQTSEISLALIASQNIKLNTQTWSVIECCDEGQNQLLTLGIDQSSVDIITSSGNKILYGFSHIPVKYNNRIDGSSARPSVW